MRLLFIVGGNSGLTNIQKRLIKRESTDVTQLSTLKLLRLEFNNLDLKNTLHSTNTVKSPFSFFFFFLLLTLSKCLVSYKHITDPSSGSKNYKY